MAYLWIKALHIVAMASFMAGLFYLPRLYVYHAEHGSNPGFVEVVKIQEFKLYYYIEWLAMVLVILSGAALLYLNPALLKLPYMHVKLLAALLLFLYHFTLGHYLKLFRVDECAKSGRFFRIYNEVPTILFIILVCAIIVGPGL